jgi:Tfp pilus assembly protein PilP
MLPAMKNAVFALMAAMLIVSGCTTTSFAGLAKAGYVDQVKTSAQATDADLKALQQRVDAMKAVADRMQQLASQMEQTQKTTAELQQLAKQVEERLPAIPKETLRMLVKSIEDYLAK